MRLDEYARYDAVGLRDLIRSGEVTAAEVEQAARAAIEVANAELNGLALPVFEPALDRSADPHAPFAGVPFLIKDSGPVAAGVPFFLGSRAVPGVVMPHDSELMTRFRGAGLVTLGLTTAPEMAISFATESVRYGITRNPWDPERGAGGSSGGAAALVAAGAVPIAHATDGAGSIRVPASACGLVGLKPTRGRTPCGPDLGESFFGISYNFALTRTVRDTAHLLDAVSGPAPGDKYGAPTPLRPYSAELGADVPPLRIGVTTRAWSGVAVDPEAAGAATAVAGLLGEIGHRVDEAGPSVDWESVLDGLVPEVVSFVAAPLLGAPRPPDPARLEAVTRQILHDVHAVTALDLIAAFDAHNRVSRSVGTFFADHDLLITPTLGQLPAPHGTLDFDDPKHSVRGWLETIFAYGPFTALFNVTGQPAISLPLGHSADGLPIGVQLVAPFGREDTLLRVAALLEQALPWHDRVPPTFVGGR
ncbi:amidase [Embleya sp. NPDC056575]|uniref:amidase n=1 Tax=unclassified Embleya TaxID=2699296 RepID=UPI003693FAFD